MEKRSPIKIVALSIITLGIYYLYWLVSTRRVLNQNTHVRIPSPWLLIGPALITAGIYFASIVFAAVDDHSNIDINVNLSNHVGEFVILIIVVFLGGSLTFLAWFYWFWKYSKAVEQYTKKEISSTVVFILLWLLSIFGIAAAIIQDKYNKLLVSTDSTEASLATPSEPSLDT